MFTFAKLVVCLIVAISVAATPESHLARNVHRHREIVARVAQTYDPSPKVVVPGSEIAGREIPPPAKRFVRRKRARSGSCSNSSSSLPPTTSPVDNPTPTSIPTDSPSPSPTSSGDGGSDPGNTSTPQDLEPSTSISGQLDLNIKSTPTPTPTHTTTTTRTPTPTTTSGGNTGGGQTYSGDGTWYGTGLGACGITNNDSQDIVAVSHLLFDSYPGYNGLNPNTNPLCGKTIKATYNGVTVVVTLTDRCTGCQYSDLDFSPHAFDKLAAASVGRIHGVVWEFTD